MLTVQPGETYSDVLVFAPWNTPTICDIFITSYPTRAQPAQKRGLPANAIYRYAKFAYLHWDLDSFEYFTMGAVDRIEQEVFVSGFLSRELKSGLSDISPQMSISLGVRSGSTIAHCCYTSFKRTRPFGMPAPRSA